MTYRILTVCTGNICRSPMAEVVLDEYAKRAGADVEVGSAAITSYEVGNPIDYRAQKILREGGYDVPRRGAQQVTRDDIVNYDLILPMTRDHLHSLERLARSVPEDQRAEIRLWKDFASDADQQGNGLEAEIDVPDPWYGGIQDFVETLEILEDAADNIIAHATQGKS